jgi:hypothetical protein
VRGGESKNVLLIDSNISSNNNNNDNNSSTNNNNNSNSSSINNNYNNNSKKRLINSSHSRKSTALGLPLTNASIAVKNMEIESSNLNFDNQDFGLEVFGTKIVSNSSSVGEEEEGVYNENDENNLKRFFVDVENEKKLRFFLDK